MRDTRITRRQQQDIIHAFAAGAGCGFLAGVLLVGTLLWQGSAPRALGVQKPISSSAAAQGNAGIDNVPAKPADLPAGTSGTGGTSSSSTGTATPSPGESPKDLAARDLEIPVDGVRADQLVDSYSEKRGEHSHEALDILAPEGTPVRAVEDGTIAKLFTSKAGGITIYQFDPGQQYCYYYAHLQRYAEDLREGDIVHKGEVIGYVGTTGNAPKDTPHLHFAIFRLTPEKHWWEGTPIDPYDVLR